MFAPLEAEVAARWKSWPVLNTVRAEEPWSQFFSGVRLKHELEIHQDAPTLKRDRRAQRSA